MSNFNNLNLPFEVQYPENLETYPDFHQYWYDTGFERGAAEMADYIFTEWEATLARCRGNKSVAIGQFLPFLTNLANEARNIT
jgi:hypothetical protein